MRLRTRFSDSPILKSTVGVIELIQMTNAIDHFVASIDHATPMWGTSGWWTKQPLSTPAEKCSPFQLPHGQCGPCHGQSGDPVNSDEHLPGLIVHVATYDV